MVKRVTALRADCGIVTEGKQAVFDRRHNLDEDRAIELDDGRGVVLAQCVYHWEVAGNKLRVGLLF